MKQPIKHILAQLPLSEVVKSAILDGEGMMGKALVCAKAIENAQWDEMEFAQLDQNELTEVYRQSVEWAGEVMGQCAH